MAVCEKGKKVVHRVQVILPFLKWSFDANNGGGGGGGEAATMLDILSRLVQEQPTAMALIRHQIIPTTVLYSNAWFFGQGYHRRYTHKTFSYIMSSYFQTFSYRTSRIQNVQLPMFNIPDSFDPHVPKQNWFAQSCAWCFNPRIINFCVWGYLWPMHCMHEQFFKENYSYWLFLMPLQSLLFLLYSFKITASLSFLAQIFHDSWGGGGGGRPRKEGGRG